jgi:hypothetical protein
VTAAIDAVSNPCREMRMSPPDLYSAAILRALARTAGLRALPAQPLEAITLAQVRQKRRRAAPGFSR